MTVEPATYQLPENMRVEDCVALDQFLRDAADRPVQLDAAQTAKFGGLAAQVIAAHQKIRAGGGATLVIDAPSDGLHAALNTLGLVALLDQQGGET